LITRKTDTRPGAAAAEEVLTFWFEETKPSLWFRRNAIFDQSIRDRFGALYQASAAGRLDVWRAHPRHALALIIVLDQFSRNIYRDDPRAFAQDEKAIALCEGAMRRRFDIIAEPTARSFFYMPLMHSEKLPVQKRSLQVFKARLPGTMNVPYAIDHHDIIARFGRFPHRNKTLGRISTPQEIAFLKTGGFNP